MFDFPGLRDRAPDMFKGSDFEQLFETTSDLCQSKPQATPRAKPRADKSGPLATTLDDFHATLNEGEKERRKHRLPQIEIASDENSKTLATIGGAEWSRVAEQLESSTS